MGGSTLIDSMNDGTILPEAEVLPSPTMRRGSTRLAVPQIRHPQTLVGAVQRIDRAIQIGDFLRCEKHRLLKRSLVDGGDVATYLGIRQRAPQIDRHPSARHEDGQQFAGAAAVGGSGRTP